MEYDSKFRKKKKKRKKSSRKTQKNKRGKERREGVKHLLRREKKILPREKKKKKKIFEREHCQRRNRRVPLDYLPRRSPLRNRRDRRWSSRSPWFFAPA